MILSQNSRVFSALFRQGILPVLPQADIYTQKKLLDVFAEAGVAVIEYRDAITGRRVDVFHELVAHAAQYPEFHIGGNTIQKKIAEKFIQGGASFITSTFMKDDMAEASHRNDVPWIPGCSSSVDIERASALGAAAISLLPWSWTSSDVATINRHYPHLGVIPSTGMVMNNSAKKEWIKAGALCIRVDKQVLTPQDITVKDWNKIKRSILSVISMIRTVRTVEHSSIQTFNVI
jgi:2-dehydro-3-deoxyphosphogluconate aldolase/(4S)-4-hydroxy-2-oxoglutarate aldolase